MDAKASTTTLTAHTDNNDIHVTAEDKATWNQGIVGTPVGCIFPFAGINLPAGYLLCDGTSYKKTDYPDLYAVIGNKYGGDTENFNVPNLIDKFIQGSTTSGTQKKLDYLILLVKQDTFQKVVYGQVQEVVHLMDTKEKILYK